ncbi:phosphotransferase family protein [Actinopolymorpha singaporensis]|uniref:Phosphotransferase enzyme family protein n=1 Tax=Actinopolymorpha singaporensis TaxID=117157 RepID=A0A1H1TSZ8_9ACTN|nr:aminoglycoside phosphotransferase family protein [Actinopolymorpha singaporensis]SDS62719.1 Phosphotransferase enzyme family protein [Actinopolymorpha singaporensis]
MTGTSSTASGRTARLVAGHCGLEGVRRAVSDPLAHGLQPLLDQCLPARPGLAPPRLLRSKYKPGRKLTAYYTLEAGSDCRAPRHIAVTWSTVPADLGEASALEPEAEARGLVEPFTQLVAASPDGCLTLMTAPIDPAFPALVRLYEPGYVTATASSLDRRSTAGRGEVHTIRYRPGQRHVLRVVTAEAAGQLEVSPPASGGSIVKVYRDETGALVTAVAAALDAVLTASVPGVRPARSIGYVEADRAAWWAVEDGEPLWRRLSDPRAPEMLRRIGQAVRLVHEAGPVPVDSARPGAASWPGQASAHPWIPALPRHDAFAELAVTARAAEHIHGLLPHVGARMRDVISRLGVALDARPAEPVTLTHGDLKCDNLLATQGEVRLIDLDRAAIAEPALDLGKFVADVSWWCDSLGVDARPAISAFVDGYGPCDRVRLARARDLAVLFHLKLAARRIPVHHPQWAERVVRAVRLAENAVAGGAR